MGVERVERVERLQGYCIPEILFFQKIGFLALTIYFVETPT
jgi:hypothetical protein